MYISKPH